MSEPVYRRDESGRLIEVAPNEQNRAPEARGKAAALSRYLAKKGSPSGKRLDRHVQRFERMWANAPDEIKNKYARQSATDLAPIERPAGPPKVTNESLNAARPGETTAQVYARQRASRTGQAVTTAAPVQSPVEMASNPGRSQLIGRSSAAASPVAIGTPEEQARVQAMINEGSGFATAFNGVGTSTDALEDVGTKAAKAVEAASKEIYDPNVEAVRKEAGQQDAQAKQREASAAAQATKAEQDQKVNAERARLGLPAITPAPPAAAPQAANASPVATAAPKPATPPPVAGPRYGSRGRTSDQSLPTPPAAPTGSGVLPTPMSKDGQRMDPAIKSDGAGLTRVNRLTGLPFGHSPGDAPPKSADAAMQQRGADSQFRQNVAQAAAPARPAPPVAAPRAMPRGPASQPERTDSAIAPIAPPRANDPDIIRKDNVAAANYQSSFSGGNPGDAEFEAAKNGQKKLYDGASSLDQSKLAVNTLKRNAALDDTRGAPRAKVIAPPVRRPILAR